MDTREPPFLLPIIPEKKKERKDPPPLLQPRNPIGENAVETQSDGRAEFNPQGIHE